MFQLFRKQTPVLVAIDIGTTSVRLLELSEDKKDHYRVECYGIEYLPEGAVVDKEILKVDVVGEGISKLVKAAKPNTTDAAISVASSAVISKVIQFPASMSEEEIGALLQVEADKYLPYDIDEVSMDFEIQGICENDPDSVNVLLVAVRGSHVDSRIEVLEMAGLTAKVVDVEQYALERACNFLNYTGQHGISCADDHVVAIFSIGGTVTTVDVLHNGLVVYNRESSFGGAQLIRAIQARYQMSETEAYQAKSEGKLPEGAYEEVFIPFREILVQQISRSLQLFFSSTDYREVNTIFLAGGQASLEGLTPLIKERIGIEAAIMDPISHMSMNSKVRKKECLADSTALLVCSGLAMRSFC